MAVITVADMVCRHDVRVVSARVADVDGVIAIEVDRAARTVSVEGDVTVEALRRAVAAAGYQVS